MELGPENTPKPHVPGWRHSVSKLNHSRWRMLAPLGLIVLASFTGNVVRIFCLVGAVGISIWIIYDTEVAKGADGARHSRRKHLGLTALAALILMIVAFGIFWASNRIESFAQSRGKNDTTKTVETASAPASGSGATQNAPTEGTPATSAQSTTAQKAQNHKANPTTVVPIRQAASRESLPQTESPPLGWTSIAQCPPNMSVVDITNSEFAYAGKS